MSESEIHLLFPFLHPSTLIISLPRTFSSIHTSSLCTHFFIHPFFHPSIHQHKVPNLLSSTFSSIHPSSLCTHFFIHPSVIIMYPLFHPSIHYHYVPTSSSIHFHPSIIPGSGVKIKPGPITKPGRPKSELVASKSARCSGRPGLRVKPSQSQQMRPKSSSSVSDLVKLMY
jgi:hypothetical protein